MTGYNIKSIREDFKSKGIFYTPKELAELLKSYLPKAVKEVYDPTCGHGSLLSVFADDVKKYGQDINDIAVEEAKKLPNSIIECGDTLKYPKFLGKRFKAIVANPPFSIKWEPKQDERFSPAPALAPKSKADYAFIMHILHYLADDGTAVVMEFPGILYRGNAEGKIRRWLVEQNYIEKVIHIPGNTFVDTAIATCILVLKKNKTTTDITFINTEDDIERTVKLEEVAANDYSLSVNIYAYKEPEKEVIDIDAVELEIEESLCRNLDVQLNVSFNLWKEMGSRPLDTLLEKLERIINKYKKLIKEA